jgi:hypothetical protein
LIDVIRRWRDESDMDPPSDRMLLVGLGEGEVAGVLKVGVSSSSSSTAPKATVAAARSGTRRVTWSNIAA